jgi:hypothetical protein
MAYRKERREKVGAGSVVKVVEHLLSKLKILSSNLETVKERKKERERDGGREDGRDGGRKEGRKRVGPFGPLPEF